MEASLIQYAQLGISAVTGLGVLFGLTKQLWKATTQLSLVAKTQEEFKTIFNTHMQSDTTNFNLLSQDVGQLKLDVAVIKDRVFREE